MILDKIIYNFESDSYCLFEIKLKIDNEIDKSKLYHWLLFDKYNQTLQELDFVSMIDNSRLFKQGRLVFDNEKAILLPFFTNGVFIPTGLSKVLEFNVSTDEMNVKYILTNFT